MGKVFFVATPIGNLGDFSYRAVQTLNDADVILCEDTRHSRVLLDRYGIKKPLKAYHKFNEAKTSDAVCDMAEEGKNVAVISDAGMPCISDPGYFLVRKLIERGIEYTVIPGPCAFVNAFVMSGFEAPFTFVGFLKEKQSEFKKQLESLPSTCLIFYSSVHNVNDDLKKLYAELGNRRVCVVREISKMFEEVLFFDLKDAQIENPKGEFVLIVDAVKEQSALNSLSVEEHVNFYVKNGLTKMEAIKKTAKDRGVGNNEIYKFFID